MAILLLILLSLLVLATAFVVHQWITFFTMRNNFPLVTRKSATQPNYIPGPANFYLWKMILHRIFTPKNQQKHMVDLMLDAAENCGGDKPVQDGGAGICHVGFFGNTMLLVCDPDLAKQVMLNPVLFPKVNIGNIENFITKFLGPNNLVFIEGEQWKKIRPIMNPAFYRVERYYDVIVEKVEKSVQKMVHEKVMPWEVTKSFAIDVLGKSLLDYDFHSLDNSDDKYLKAYSSLLHEQNNPIDQLFPFINKLPTQRNKQIAENLKLVDDLVQQVIQEGKKRLETASNESMSLLEMLVSESEKLNPAELRDNLMILLVAGHETTASALVYLLFLLAKNTAIQQRAYEDVQQATGGKTTFPATEDLAKMNYVQACILESMRRYNPTGLITPKIATKTCELGGYLIPKGSIVNVLFHGIHRSKYIWKKPLEFNPERFLDSQGNLKNVGFNFIGFSAGARVCIGNSFSLLEQKGFIVRLLQQFQFELEDTHYEIGLNTLSLDSVYAPESCMKLKFKPRK